MAFVPASEIHGLAVVYPLGRRPVSFASAVDSFFAGNTVWLYWMSVFMVLGAAIAFWPVTVVTGAAAGVHRA